MDRGQEIEFAANAAIDGLCSLEGFDKTDMCNMFASGVTWADAHPKVVDNDCKFCNGEEITDEDCEDYKLSYERGYMYVDIDIPYEGVICNFKINYCPMCGRKLSK